MILFSSSHKTFYEFLYGDDFLSEVPDKAQMTQEDLGCRRLPRIKRSYTKTESRKDLLPLQHREEPLPLLSTTQSINSFTQAQPPIKTYERAQTKPTQDSSLPKQKKTKKVVTATATTSFSNQIKQITSRIQSLISNDYTLLKNSRKNEATPQDIPLRPLSRRSDEVLPTQVKEQLNTEDLTARRERYTAHLAEEYTSGQAQPLQTAPIAQDRSKQLQKIDEAFASSNSVRSSSDSDNSRKTLINDKNQRRRILPRPHIHLRSRGNPACEETLPPPSPAPRTPPEREIFYLPSFHGEYTREYLYDTRATRSVCESPKRNRLVCEFISLCYPYTNRGTRRHLRHRGQMGRMERNTLDEHERKIIIEFCHLLEKSKQLFNGLRELPQYGHKQWHSYFGRTFDVYTKLWKFQQQHRATLDVHYGLRRWQIGEIASKIGQLYYHFYLRTSETAYLHEAYSFYYAIRGRCYYTNAFQEDKCELMVKKLRYYARFIVVCLLLKKIKLVRELIKELDKQIIEYGNTYNPDDQIEWTVVVDEVKAFLQAEPVVSVIHPDNYPVILSHRLSPLTTPPVERSPQMILSLQEVLIVGSSSQQVKFSELTMDMFRMLQTLEREPAGDLQHIYDDSPRQRFASTPNAPTSKGYNLEGGQRRENSHKYLLFKPSPTQVLVYLASGCNDLPPNGALLLYISAEGQIVQQSKHAEDAGYDIGGLITTSKNDIYRECGRDPKAAPPSKYKEYQCLHPGDLYPFTRRPLFIIIDSDNSYVFQHIPRHFGQPLVVLMSPLELPSPFHDRKHQGSLFTLFLHSPLTAFCYCCDIHTISLPQWDRAQVYIDTFMAEASQLAVRSRIDVMYIAFMGDDFLRLLLLRFIFCEVTLRMHRLFRARTHLTRSSPPLPDDLLEHPGLVHIVMDLASHLQVRGTIQEPSTAGPPPAKD